MPKEYGRRSEQERRGQRPAKPHDVTSRTELGPRGGTRRAHFLENTVHQPQGASATGSQAVTSRRLHDEAGMITLPPPSIASVAKIGVTATPQATHANRASCSSDHGAKATVGDGCPGDDHLNRLNVVSQREKTMTPNIASLESVTLEEALAYLESAEGDELVAAYSLAKDRNVLEGSDADPDDAEVHHALFLLRRARGLNAPSFDLMRVQLRRLVAA
jgi:hypothetical protein